MVTVLKNQQATKQVAKPRKPKIDNPFNQIIQDDKILIDGSYYEYDTMINNRFYLVKGLGLYGVYRNKVYPVWLKDDLPTVHSRYMVQKNNKTELVYDVEVNGYRSVVTTYELLSGSFINQYPTLSNIASKKQRDLYIDLIRQVAELNDASKKVSGVPYYGVMQDEHGNYFRMLPNGEKRVADNTSMPSTVLYPLPELPISERAWNERLHYAIPTLSQQKQASTFFNTLTPRGEIKFMLVYGVSAMQRWLDDDSSTIDLPNGVSMGLIGEQGCGKTTLGRIALTPAYPYTGMFQCKVNFNCTDTDIELRLKHSKHTPFMFDDNNDAVNDKKSKATLNTFIRSTFNPGSVRGRSNARLEQVPSSYVRTNPIFTSEIVPNVIDSIKTRMIMIHIEKDYIERDRRKECSIADIGKHIVSIYHWADTYDKYMLNRVKNEGYDAVVKDLADLQNEIGKEVITEIESKWEKHYVGIKQDDMFRVSQGIAYIITHARLLDTITDCIFKFEESIRDLIIDSMIRQLAHIIHMDDDNNSIVIDAVCTLLEKIARGERIDGEYYQVASTKGDLAPNVKNPFTGDEIPTSQWGFNIHKGNVHEKPLMFIRDNSLVLTSTAKQLMLKDERLSKVCKTTEDLNQQFERENLLSEKGTKQSDILIKFHGKVTRGLAVKLDTVLDALLKNPNNEETSTQSTGEIPEQTSTQNSDSAECFDDVESID